MSEEEAWLEAASSSLTTGEAALATVVQVQGSAYRRAGSRMLVRADGSRVGSISGGCLEADVAAAVPEVLSSGQVKLLRLDTTSPEDAIFGYGSGCSGIIDVLVEPLDTAAGRFYLSTLQEVRTSRRPAALLTVTSGPLMGQRAAVSLEGPLENHGRWSGVLAAKLLTAQRTLEQSVHEGKSAQVTLPTVQGEAQAFMEVLLPPLHLHIFGADEDAAVLARFARELGWPVSVFDFRPRLLETTHFPAGTHLVESRGGQLARHLTVDSRSAALVASRHYLYDVAALRVLLAAPPPYLGVLGSETRLARLLGEVLQGEPCPDVVHAPAGLNLGARNPAEISVSIVGEILATFSGEPKGVSVHRWNSSYVGA